MYISKWGRSVVAATLLGLSLPALAQGEGQLITPDSSTYQASNPTNNRTFFKIFQLDMGVTAMNAQIAETPAVVGKPPVAGLAFATPASMACIYGLTAKTASCNPNSLTTSSNATGGSKAIAIVDAYHYPNALADLKAFSAQFGLPAPTTSTLQIVYASGTKPATSPWGWEVEAALDLQWAHAMAPNAKLILVEAASSSHVDMMKAVQVASNRVAAAGGGQVSMSWGHNELSSDPNDESYFQTPGVVYFASSGDSAGTTHPCVSPNVVCVGGTTLRQTVAGNFIQEVAWMDGGGGISQYFSKPAYQSGVAAIAGTKRGVPDVALAADPITGAWVRYTPSDASAPAGWYTVGGTSWSSPAFAGIVNSAASFAKSSAAELTKIYANLGTANYSDIKAGWCNFYASSTAVAGWDKCTGVGTNVGKVGK